MDLSLRSAHPNCPGSTPVIAVMTMMMTIGKMAMMIDRKANHYKDPFTKQWHRNSQTHACLHCYTIAPLIWTCHFQEEPILQYSQNSFGARRLCWGRCWSRRRSRLARLCQAITKMARCTFSSSDNPADCPAVFLRSLYPNVKQLSSEINCRPPRLLI